MKDGACDPIHRSAAARFPVLLLLLCMHRLDAQTAWTVQQSSTQQDLWGVCEGDNRQLVVVGNGGTIITSVDAVTWTQQQSGTANWLLAVAVSQQQFVAVGDQGTILYSADASTWTLLTVGNARFNGVAYGGGIWLAVGEGGAVARSTNGTQWIAGNAGVVGWLRGIVYRSDLGLFVVTGQGGTLLSTQDGITFKAIVSGTSSDIECIGEGGAPAEDVIAGSNGYVADSADNVKWTEVVPAGSTHFRGCIVVGSTAVCVGSGGVILNAELGHASAQTVPSGTGSDLYAAYSAIGYYSNAYAVAVGQRGVILTSPLEVPSATAINPSALAPALGSAVTFSVNAGGQAPLSYQWAFNDAPIAGATSTTLSLPGVQPSQNGNYSVTVSNLLGSQTLGTELSANYQPAIPGLIDESFNPALPLPYFLQSPDIAIESLRMPAAAAVQPDGKVIINCPSITRLNTDGTPDATFNAAALQANIPGLVTGILIQPDGRILASSYSPGGFTTALTPAASYSWSVRLNSDGTTDASYTPDVVTSGGVLTQDAIPQFVLSDGRYLASANGKIVRLSQNGAIDPTFVPTSPEGACYALDPSRRVVVGGGASDLGIASIFRLNPDGTSDANFAATTVAGKIDCVYAQASGKVVYLFETSDSLPGGFTVRRLNADGSPDSTYPGFSTPSIPATIAATTMTPDGSLWIDATGQNELPEESSDPIITVNGNYHNGIIRIDPNGNLDPAYALNVEGMNFDIFIYTYSLISGPAQITGILQAPGGQWYVWGNFAAFNGEPRVGLVRINPQVGSQYSKLGNISARVFAGSASQTLIVGFVTRGPGDMTMLLRGVGPGLAGFGVTGFLLDPEIVLYDPTGALQLTDNDWGNGADATAVATTAAQVGAFPLASGSLDAAALALLSPGTHTFEVYGNGGGAGIALAEAYDTDTSAPSFSSPRAVNFSCRSATSPGTSVLTAGFVIEGGNSKRVLIRAVGPSLASFGVSGVLADPVLTLYNGSLPIGVSDPGWSTDQNLREVIADVGAFSLALGSQDSVMSPMLAPGAYTAEVTSLSGGSGVVLLEVYEVP